MVVYSRPKDKLNDKLLRCVNEEFSRVDEVVFNCRNCETSQN